MERRRDLVIDAQIDASAFFLAFILNTRYSWYLPLACGCYYSQLMIVSGVLVFVIGRPLSRLAVAGSLATLAWYQLALDWPVRTASWFALMHWGAIAMDVALLKRLQLRLRLRCYWPGTDPQQQTERYQYSIGELLLTTTAAALVLWLGLRWLDPTPVELRDVLDAARWLMLLIPIHWLMTLPAGAAAMRVRSKKELIVALAWGLLGCLVVTMATHWLITLGMGLDNLHLPAWFGFLCGQALSGFATMAIFRLLGFRFEQAPQAGESAGLPPAS